jgi:tRNA(adenine34) deaminase
MALAVSADDHTSPMALALAQARRAAALGEVPVGAVVTGPDGALIAAAHNRRELDQDPTAHAEMLALRQAAAALGSWRLSGCTLFVTLEPCPMCAGALVNARVDALVYGCDDPKAGAVSTLYALCEDERLNHRLLVTGGVMAEECAALLRDFFAALRATRG